MGTHARTANVGGVRFEGECREKYYISNACADGFTINYFATRYVRSVLMSYYLCECVRLSFFQFAGSGTGSHTRAHVHTRRHSTSITERVCARLKCLACGRHRVRAMFDVCTCAYGLLTNSLSCGGGLALILCRRRSPLRVMFAVRSFGCVVLEVLSRGKCVLL